MGDEDEGDVVVLSPKWEFTDSERWINSIIVLSVIDWYSNRTLFEFTLIGKFFKLIKND